MPATNGESTTLAGDTPGGPEAPLERWADDDDARAGLRDYWAVYERHYQEIRGLLLADLADDPELASIIQSTPREELEERGRASLELLRAAIFDGAWDAWKENLRTQGAAYAQRGLSFAGWFRLMTAYRPHILRHLLVTYASDTQRLVRAVSAMDRLLDVTMSAIGGMYLKTMEDLVSRQREAIGELRSRARYQVILDSIADAVITTDPYGNVMTVNPAMEALSGVAADDAIGRRYTDMFPAISEGRELPWEERPLFHAIQRRETVKGPEGVMLRRADGIEIPISITAAPVLDQDGRLLGAVAVMREAPQAD